MRWTLVHNFVRSSDAARQSASDDKAVEQARKNISVLKGLPSSQLFPLMNFVGASFGVRRAYCHVNRGGDDWVWESDDRETKRAARRMMRMVLDLNRNNPDAFRGDGVMRGTREAPQGRSWPLEIIVKEPDKFLMVVNVPGQGEIRQGLMA